MRTTFTAMLVACLGLIAASNTASAQLRSRYVSYYGGAYGGYYGGYRSGSDVHRANWMDRASQTFSGGGY